MVAFEIVIILVTMGAGAIASVRHIGKLKALKSLIEDLVKLLKQKAFKKNKSGETNTEIKTTNSQLWDNEPRERGRDIETHLTQTDYKDWQKTDDLINPKTNQPYRSNNFPKVDFQKDNNLVSLKTVDTNTGSWKNDMKNHIVDLKKTNINIDGKTANKILDIRVQPRWLR